MADPLKFSLQRKSLLSGNARIQVPWVKVTIGGYTFGIFDNKTKQKPTVGSDYKVDYPNYIRNLTVTKINGQVNQYTLGITYPITQFDDPNFFEKVFSRASRDRKIVFTYGDAAYPAYTYKDEEAVITGISQSFDISGSAITYEIRAVSGAALTASGTITRLATGNKVKPSDEIKALFKSADSNLRKTFYGMTTADLDTLIAGDDQPVVLESKRNVSALDYLAYLASCMIPKGTKPGLSKDIYILTFHDDSSLDPTYEASHGSAAGPYFKVSKVTYGQNYLSDAYEIDIGYNTRTVVHSFSIDSNENFSIYYDYQKEINKENYVHRLSKDGTWETIYSPEYMPRNNKFTTEPEDITWWTKATKYPISATITVQGLLRPATLLQYVRLNVIFAGGHKHISSGLYIVTKQTDTINETGYMTQLTLTRVDGDNNYT